MDFLSKLIEYRSSINEVKISGDEHLKIILQDSSNYLKKAYEKRDRISSDTFLPSYYKEELLKEANGYIERVEQALKRKNNQINDLDVLPILTHALAFLIGHHMGYNKKSDEISEKQEFMSEALATLMEELKKYL
jgi:hypothetical protein